MQIYPKEFTRFEVAAIGIMTIQWAYLEHMLLIATAELVDKANVAMPSEAMSISFERRVNAFRTLIKDTVTDSWKRTQLLSLATKITNIQNDRHRVTHGLWEWYPSNPVKTDRRDPKAIVSTLKRFVVESGKPGAVPD